jgi:hypothetical protein
MDKAIEERVAGYVRDTLIERLAEPYSYERRLSDLVSQIIGHL